MQCARVNVHTITAGRPNTVDGAAITPRWLSRHCPYASVIVDRQPCIFIRNLQVHRIPLLRRYRPQPYSGRTVVFTVTDYVTTPRPLDWLLPGEVEYYSIPRSHRDVLTEKCLPLWTPRLSSSIKLSRFPLFVGTHYGTVRSLLILGCPTNSFDLFSQVSHS